MKKSVFIVLAGLFVCGFFASGLFSAPDETPESLYARGVYLFFNGRSDEAEPCFRRGIELSPDNPANFYFLGLIELRRGRADRARDLFTQGAEAEWTPRGRLVDVPGHLLRIQGNERLLIEDARRRVSLARRENERRLSEALFGSDIQQQRRRLAASLAAGQTAAAPPPPAAGLPSVPPINPLFQPEVDGYISEELANSDKEGFISLQKNERLDENGNVIKLDYLSTEAKRRAERRRTVAEDRRIASENFIDIFDTENTSSDNTTFDGGQTAPPPPKKEKASGDDESFDREERAKNREPNPPKNGPVGSPAPFDDDEEGL